MMLCEIINPSDSYTLRTDDFLCGAVAVAILGEGYYGLRNLDTQESSPVLFGWDEWLKEQDILDLSEYIRQNEERLADVLDSIIIGDKTDREEIEAALKFIPASERKEFLEKRHDHRRSSMNDIGRAARDLAKVLRDNIRIRNPPDKVLSNREGVV